MASRMKEDEKNEKIIRGLLKLPANRRCINCNSLGPQYVCTNFWTFVCTTCSGIHREFTHRVKSVSMAKFTSQEVSSLQEGGNERARVIYFKEWDPQRHTAPDSSNVDRLRDFIKHVYVDRRYTGERFVDKPPRVKMGEKDDSYENRRVDTYRGGSRSPSYEDRYDRNYSDRSSLGGRTDDRSYRYNYDERRSPGYDQETRYGDYRKSPGRFEVVDDRRRDDRLGNGRRSDESRFSDSESRFDGRSPNRQKDLDTSSPPMVRPVRDILGEDAPPLRISGPPKPNDGKVADGSAKTQRTASSSSMGSVDASSVDLKGGNSGSLIDFDADPEPPATTAVPPARSTTSMAQSIPQPTASASTDGGNWASFDFAPQAPVQTQTQAPVQTQTQASGSNTLESLLSQLSAPATASVVFPTAGGGAPTVAPVSKISMSPISAGAQAVVSNASLHINGGFTASPAGNVSTLPSSGGASVAAPGFVMSLPIRGGDHGGQWPNTQQNQPSLLPADSGSIASQFTPSVGGAPNNQPWNSSFMQNVHGPLNATAQQAQAASRPTQETIGVSASQPAPSETKTTGRKELPADLFTATYSTVRMPVPHWHTGISPGMGYGMQYPTAMPMQVQQMQSFPRPSKPTNPFDLNSESTLVHAQSFPSIASLQGALPNMAAPSGLVHSSSLGTMPLQWMPPQSPSYASAMPPSAYMGQQLPTNVQALGHQGSGGFGSETASFGTVNSDPQMGGRYSLPATSNSFSSVGGNPFG